MLGLELLRKVKRVVDESESGAGATTENRAKAEAEHDVGLRLVHARQFLTDFRLFYRRLARVQHVNDLSISIIYLAIIP